jgi:hypothetical protein
MSVEHAFEIWKAKPENLDKLGMADVFFPLDYMYNHEYGTGPDPDDMLITLKELKKVDDGVLLEIGKSYRNTLGEVRTIVGPYDDGPYVFIDDQDFTYTKHGIYDRPDYWVDADVYALIEEVNS